MSHDRRIDDFEAAAAAATARITAKTNGNLVLRQSANRRIRRYRIYSFFITTLAVAVIGYGLMVVMPAPERARLLGFWPLADLTMPVAVTNWDRTELSGGTMFVVKGYATSMVPTSVGMWWWLLLPADGVKPRNAQVVKTDSGQQLWAIPAEEAHWIDASNVPWNAVPGCELKHDQSHADRWMCGDIQAFQIDRSAAAPDPVGLAIGSATSWTGQISIYGWGTPGERHPILPITQPNP